MRRMVVLLALVACGKTGDPALDTVGHAQVIDIQAADPQKAFTAHLERKGARWTRRTTRTELVDPSSGVRGQQGEDHGHRARGSHSRRARAASVMSWTVDGELLSDIASLDASYRAMVTEIGIDGAVEWQLSGPAF